MARVQCCLLVLACTVCGTPNDGPLPSTEASTGSPPTGTSSTPLASTGTGTEGSATGGSGVDSTGSTDGSTTGTDDSTGLSPAPGVYGNPQVAWSLADTQWGGDSELQVTHRVRFPRTGTLVSVRLFTIYVEGSPGGEALYHKGDGGTFRAMLQTDDDTENHYPSGDVLGQTEHLIGAPPMYAGSGPPEAIVGGDPGDSPFFRNFYFDEPIAVDADIYYHLVVENTTLDPTAHFVSRDDFVAGTRDRAAKVPTRDPLDDAILYRSPGDTDWTAQSRNWAIGVFTYDDGSAFGNGYMEVSSVSGPDRVARYVDADASVRQVFIPPEDMVVETVNVGAMHVSGTNSMMVRLTDGDDIELWAGALGGFPTDTPASDPLGDVSSMVAEFRGTASSSIPLNAGQTYVLELTADGGVHTIVGTRDGSLSYTFPPDSTVMGRAEFREGAGQPWEGWPVRDTAVDDQFDLAFFLEVEFSE